MVVSQLAHTLTIEIEHATRDSAGRVRQEWVPLLESSTSFLSAGPLLALSMLGNELVRVVGPLAQGGPEETALWGQQQHDVIYTLMTPGVRYTDAKPGDRFRDENGRFYYIRGIDDTSAAGRWTIYYTSLSPSGA